MKQIVNDITNYNVEPLPKYFLFFKQRSDALGRLSNIPIMKCTSAIRQLAYGTTPEAFDEYLQIGERCSRECLHNFNKCMYTLYEQFKRRDHKYLTLMREVVASQDLWIWLAYFGVPGENNNLNVLYGSPSFDDLHVDIALEAPFVVNGKTYTKGYYLADGIYPQWSTFVKTDSFQGMQKQ